MDNFDIIEPAHFMLKVFHVVGLWHSEGCWKFIRNVHTFIIIFPFFFCFVLFMNINLAFIEDLESGSKFLYMTLPESAMLFKSFNIMLRQKEIKALLQMMQAPVLLPQNETELDIYKKANKNYNRQCRTYIIVSSVAICASLFNAAAAEAPTLPYPTWMPFDWKSSSRNYWTAYTFAAISLSTTAITNSYFDLFQAYFLFQNAIYCRILSHRLQNIGYHSESDDRAPVRKLLECIGMHHHLTRIAKATEKLISATMFCQINVSALVLCVTAFLLTQISPASKPFEVFFFIYFMGAMLIEILLPCYHGNDLIFNSEDILTGIYNSNWTELPPVYKRLMYHFMERLKRRIIVRSGGYFLLSLRALLSVLQSAYSLFALMINLQK